MNAHPTPENLGLDHTVYPSGVPSVDYVYKADPDSESGTLNPNDFQQKARDAVALYYNRFLRPVGDPIPMATSDDVFVVWFSKTLQNWKALCSTVFPDGRYFELTYNGNKRELYIDEYVKKGNNVFYEAPAGD